MSLFIETPQQEQLRLLREQREQLKHLRSMSEGSGVVGSAEDTSQMDRSLLDKDYSHPLRHRTRRSRQVPLRQKGR